MDWACAVGKSINGSWKRQGSETELKINAWDLCGWDYIMILKCIKYQGKTRDSLYSWVDVYFIKMSILSKCNYNYYSKIYVKDTHEELTWKLKRKYEEGAEPTKY